MTRALNAPSFDADERAMSEVDDLEVAGVLGVSGANANSATPAGMSQAQSQSQSSSSHNPPPPPPPTSASASTSNPLKRRVPHPARPNTRRNTQQAQHEDQKDDDDDVRMSVSLTSFPPPGLCSYCFTIPCSGSPHPYLRASLSQPDLVEACDREWLTATPTSSDFSIPAVPKAPSTAMLCAYADSTPSSSISACVDSTPQSASSLHSDSTPMNVLYACLPLFSSCLSLSFLCPLFLVLSLLSRAQHALSYSYSYLSPSVPSLSCLSSSSKQRTPTVRYSPKPCTKFLFLLSLFSCLPLYALASPSYSFTVLSMNTNGYAGSLKLHNFASMVSHFKPHAYIVNETKSSQPVASRAHLPEYRTYESPGCPAGKGRGKWGVILGIHNSVQVLRRVDLPRVLDGRAVALDVVVPVQGDRARVLRILGLYAPWDPGADDTARLFWPTVTNLCRPYDNFDA